MTSTEFNNRDLNVDESQIQFYRENGFIIIRGLLNEEQLNVWRNAVDNAAKSRGHVWLPFNGQTRPSDNYYSRVFTQSVNLWTTDPVMKEILFHAGKTIGRIACALEGIDCIRLWHDQALIKEPYANPTSWHFDVFYWSFDSTHAISAWVALDDVDADNGSVYFLPKSHKVVEEAYKKEGRFRGTGIDPNMNALFYEHPELATLDAPVRGVMKAGDFSLHNGMLAHSAHANMTSGRRRAMTFQMFPDGCIFNGKQNILTTEQVSKMQVGVSVLDDPKQNPVLYDSASHK